MFKVSPYDWVNGRSSVGRILSKLLEHHDSLKEKIELPLIKFLVSNGPEEFSGKGFVKSIMRMNEEERDKILKLLNREESCSAYLQQLLKCSNPKSDRYFDVDDIDEIQTLAKFARKELENSINVLDRFSWPENDNIISKGFGDLGKNDLLWASKNCLDKIIDVLNKGWTFPEENKIIKKCKQAIKSIEKGMGSASF